MNAKVWFKTQFKRFLLYNLLIAPVVLGLYIPYNFFWLHYTTLQFYKWIFTAALMYGAANLILAPWTAVVVRFLDKKYGTRKTLPKLEVSLEAILGRVPTAIEKEIWERLVVGNSDAKRYLEDPIFNIKPSDDVTAEMKDARAAIRAAIQENGTTEEKPGAN